MDTCKVLQLEKESWTQTWHTKAELYVLALNLVKQKASQRTTQRPKPWTSPSWIINLSRNSLNSNLLLTDQDSKPPDVFKQLLPMKRLTCKCTFGASAFRTFTFIRSYAGFHELFLALHTNHASAEHATKVKPGFIQSETWWRMDDVMVNSKCLEINHRGQSWLWVQGCCSKGVTAPSLEKKKGKICTFSAFFVPLSI